jgi:hypothetical protein
MMVAANKRRLTRKLVKTLPPEWVSFFILFGNWHVSFLGKEILAVKAIGQPRAGIFPVKQC